jgi:hypothetical protein
MWHLSAECGMSATFAPKPVILINNNGTARTREPRNQRRRCPITVC